ncbi:MAG: DUF4383 domain-containing protein [Gemmatimonadales bacterium]|nr:DUF4383 domain-containing protein [Gemmatimonadales bacterium]
MAARSFALVAGVLLLVEGVWGFLASTTFGVFDTNPLHAMLALGLGVAGIRMAPHYSSAKSFCFWAGALLLTLGAAARMPGFDTLMFVTLEMNQIEAVFSMGLGIAALGASYMSRSRPVVLRLYSRDMPGYVLRTSPLFSISQSVRPGHASPL